MDFYVKMTEKVGDFNVIAEKIKVSEGTKLGWNTTVNFEDGVSCLATVNGKNIKLIRGYTLEDSFKVGTGKSLTISERLRKTEFCIYAYREVISGCSVGLRFPFRDAEDDMNKECATYWYYSLSVSNSQRLIREAASADGGKLTTLYCSNEIGKRGNLRGILEQELGRVLVDTPFSMIRSKNTDIGNAVKEAFVRNGGPETVGFDLESFTLGDIQIAEVLGPAKTAGGKKNTSYADGGEEAVLDKIDVVTRATVVVNSMGNGKVYGGTGFVLNYDNKTFIISNHHVVKNGARGEITLRFYDDGNGRGDSYTSKILAEDRLNDLVLLSVPFKMPEGLVPLELADISTLRNGESVFAIGNPRSMEYNCIRGTVANTVHKTEDDKMSRILCSLNAAHGNSGGAVVRESDGKVIGVATAIFEPSHVQSHTICVSADAIRQLIHNYLI